MVGWRQVMTAEADDRKSKPQNELMCTRGQHCELYMMTYGIDENTSFAESGGSNHNTIGSTKSRTVIRHCNLA